jgi:hypothetical protein
MISFHCKNCGNRGKPETRISGAGRQIRQEMSEDRVTLGVQTGDIEATKATKPAFMILRKQLAAHCTAPYSPTVNEFAIVLRVNGSLWHFEGEGVQRLRINRKDAYVTADFVMPEARWKGIPLEDIKSYLAAGALETLQAMCEHLKKLKIEVNAAKLIEDANLATAAFLGQDSSSQQAHII